MNRSARRSTNRKRTPRPRFGMVAKRLLTTMFLLVGVGLLVAGTVYIAAGRSFVRYATTEYIVLTSITLENKASQFSVIKVEPQQPSITLVVFSPQEKVEVIGGYGQYELRALYSLLDLEHKSLAYQRAAFAFGLNQVIDSIWTTNQIIPLEKASHARGFFQTTLLGQVRTTASWWHKLGLVAFSRSLREDQIKIKQVSSLSDWQELQHTWTDINQAACSIAVVNTTPASGLAYKMTTILESSGFRVVRTTGESTVQAETKIIVGQPKKECEPVLEAMQHVLPIEPKVENQPEASNMYRADVVLLLGEDVGKLAL